MAIRIADIAKNYKSSKKKPKKHKVFDEKELFKWLRSSLRKKWMISCPYRKEALQSVKTKGKYLCLKCNTIHIKKNVEVHHKIPCGSLLTYSDISGFIERLFVKNKNELEVLCKTCHKNIDNINKK